jgi:hypothetical protein
MRALPLVLAMLLAGCGAGEPGAPAWSPSEDAGDGADDASQNPDGADDGVSEATHEGEAPSDAWEEDTSGEGQGDASDAAPKPPVVHAELVAASPAGEATPPTWNAHLPKLAGDGVFLYAVHTYYPQAVAPRYAAIMKRRADQPGAAWTEAAKVLYPHQPPGIVIDTSARLHMVFECLRPAGADVECFQGGAGTAGMTSRFYHLVFSAHDTDGSLRFDTYANDNEFTQVPNGYDGIGTTASGVTWWSLADESWNRVVQWWSSGSAFGTGPVLSKPLYYLLYPIHASRPDTSELVLYAGEFDPGGGNNASYDGSLAFSGSMSAMPELIERAPAAPVPGTVNAYPSDVAFAPDGTAYLLSYLVKGAGQCTELIRYDNGFGQAPGIIDMGCVGNYSDLQVGAGGEIFLLTSGTGANVKLGRSSDKGATWAWQDVPIEGLPSNGDVMWFGMTVIKPYTSPLIYDASRMAFFFSGYDASNLARYSYYGTVEVQ